MTLGRRDFLAGSAAGASLTLFSPQLMAQVPTAKKLLFIIQRGAADGLAQLAPVGDPDFARLREIFLKEAMQGRALDPLFRLHPELPNIAKLYQLGEAAFVHATASVYRDRSHFDGQNILETGSASAYQRKSGWLNRLAAHLVKANLPAKALAIGSELPAALQGEFAAASFQPSNRAAPKDDFIERVNRLYGDDDALAGNLQQALDIANIAGDGGKVNQRDSTALGQLTAKLMRGANGANIAVVNSPGWDLHAKAQFKTRVQLRNVDQFIESYRTAMAGDWRNVLVIIATEFGRSAAINGTLGTDHGTGGMMYILGGAIKGGQVMSDWPGLSKSQLLDGRDLRPTVSQEAIISDNVAAHFALDPQEMRGILFPHVQDRLPASHIIA